MAVSQKSTPCPPFFWKRQIIGLILSPFIGVLFGVVVFEATLPEKPVSVTTPSVLGKAWGEHMLKQEIVRQRRPHAWKIPCCARLTFALAAIAAVWMVQCAISRRRRELEASAPETVADFDRLVAWQEPRQWGSKTLQWLQSLSTQDGQRRFGIFLAEFFCFKIMLVEILAPILYVTALVYFTWKGVDLSTQCIVQDIAGGTLVGLLYFFLEALSFRYAMEICLVHFSINGVLFFH